MISILQDIFVFKELIKEQFESQLPLIQEISSLGSESFLWRETWQAIKGS
jgi:hypothetical protein